MDLRFKTKLIKIGNSNGVIIPAQYVSNGIIDPNKEYEFVINEVENE